MKAANDRNLTNADQAFYVGVMSGSPVGTALTVFDGDMTGFYAVATLAPHRRTGLSTTIMHRGVRDVRAAGRDFVTLQVKQDSAGEAFYEHLGFRRVFVTGTLT